MAGRSDEFNYGKTTYLDQPICKHCGEKITSRVGVKRTIGLRGGPLMIWDNSNDTRFHEWIHKPDTSIDPQTALDRITAQSQMGLLHDAEPTDDRTHEGDYQRQVMEVKLHNIATGLSREQIQDMIANDRSVQDHIKSNGPGEY